MAHSVVLTWTPADDAVATSTYNVYRAGGSCPASGIVGLTFSKLNSVPVTALTYTDTSVAVGNSYCYYATQVIGSAESVLSNTAGGMVLPHAVTIQTVVLA